jgi:hypothetical protein
VTDKKKANAALVEALASALGSGGHGLEAVPALLRRLLTEDAWRNFETRRGDTPRYERFDEFVTKQPLQGLGASVRLVEKIIDSIEDEAERSQTRDLLDQALQNPPHVHPDRTDGNIVPVRPEGNTQAKALRRLRKDAPELHVEVLEGRLSAHAAMVQAGFRPKTISVPVSRPESIAAALRKHLGPDDLARLIRLLLNEP